MSQLFFYPLTHIWRDYVLDQRSFVFPVIISFVVLVGTPERTVGKMDYNSLFSTFQLSQIKKVMALL